MIDLETLRDHVRSALPQLTCEMVELEHSETRDCYAALSIETPERKKGHVYRMTIVVFDGTVNFFVHVHGASKDLTTQGAQQFSKADADLDGILAIVRACLTGIVPS